MLPFFEILAIVTPFITFFLGMLYQNHRIKKDHIREKAKEIDQELMKDINTHATEIRQILYEKKYISFGGRNKFVLNARIEENVFINILKKSDIFEVNGDEIRLIYRKDTILTYNTKNIIQYLKMYKSEVSSLKNILDNLSFSDMPPQFEDDIRDIFRDEPFINLYKEEEEDKLQNVLFDLYLVAITGSTNSHNRGLIPLYELTERQFESLQKLIEDDPKNKEIHDDIDTHLRNISRYLEQVILHIEKLHEEWQNEYIF